MQSWRSVGQVAIVFAYISSDFSLVYVIGLRLVQIITVVTTICVRCNGGIQTLNDMFNPLHSYTSTFIQGIATFSHVVLR